jgi:DNA end-binding protein Ku
LRVEVFQAGSGGSSLVIKPLTNTPHRRCGDHYASCELERIFAPILGFLSGLSDTGNDTYKNDPAAPGLDARRASPRNGCGRGGRGTATAVDAGRAGQNPPDVDAGAREADDIGPATRIALQPVDRDTGEAIERDEVVKGYEFERGQYVTFTPAELKALDIESSKTIDLETFVPRADVDPLYFNAGYYIYPDGPVATEAYRVISAAMTDARMAGLGRLTLSRRERAVLVEPRGAGLALITLRSAEEVREAQFDGIPGEVDPDAVAIARMIIDRRGGQFDPSTLRDRYQEALRELIEAKMRGAPVKAKPATTPNPVADLMAALKRSLEHEIGQPAKSKRKVTGDRRQQNLSTADVRQGSGAAKIGGKQLKSSTESMIA